MFGGHEWQIQPRPITTDVDPSEHPFRSLGQVHDGGGVDEDGNIDGDVDASVVGVGGGEDGDGDVGASVVDGGGVEGGDVVGDGGSSGQTLHWHCPLMGVRFI